MHDSQHHDAVRTCIPAVADVLCHPLRWPRFLPHVPRVTEQPDGSLRITVSWHGLRLTSTCRATSTVADTSCSLVLEHRTGLLRGLREEWIATSPDIAHLTLHSDIAWTTPISTPRRLLVQRIYVDGVRARTTAQVALLAQADWRSRAVE